MRAFSLYLHIPYCFHKCPYCDFNTYAVTKIPEREYLGALCAEIDFRATLPEWRDRELQTVYFGGGTPSLLSAAGITRLLETARRYFSFEKGAELSLEANPGPLSTDALAAFREAGINRISFGAQSLSHDTLQRLGRIHTPEQVEAAVLSAKQVGFTNINLDLMYGVPEQVIADLLIEVRAFISLAPTHISAYCLTLEKGTPFYTSFKKGVLTLPPEGVIVEMMETLEHTLSTAGFPQYEISNFANHGFEARHNLAYWNGEDYLGVGAGAHSYCRASAEGTFAQRWCNYATPKKYMDEVVAHGKGESWSEALTLRDAMFEFFFLGLRKTKGVNLRLFADQFLIPAKEVYGRLLTVLSKEGLTVSDGDMVALSPRGRMLCDSVVAQFSEPEVPLPPRLFSL